VYVEVECFPGRNGPSVKVRGTDDEGARRIGEAAPTGARGAWREDVRVVRPVRRLAQHHAECAAQRIEGQGVTLARSTMKRSFKEQTNHSGQGSQAGLRNRIVSCPAQSAPSGL
jgi:hypothetical protein